MRKLVWRVCPAETGRYRSFYRRGWPSADFGKDCVINLTCADEYRPANVKAGKHGEITIRVSDRRDRKPGQGAFTWRSIKQRAKTLKQAKEMAQAFFNEHPEIFGLEKE